VRIVWYGRGGTLHPLPPDATCSAAAAGGSVAAGFSAPAFSVGAAASCCCSRASRSSKSACALRCAHLASSVALRDLASTTAGSESLTRLAERDPIALLYRRRTTTTMLVPTSRLRGLHAGAEARRGAGMLARQARASEARAAARACASATLASASRKSLRGDPKRTMPLTFYKVFAH